ncbi:hypothetical protein D3C80_2216230 [compost metagenome]
MSKFNQKEYINNYNKTRYKQLKIAIDPNLKEEFEKAVAANNSSARSVIIHFIEKYIKENDKKS